MRLNGTMRLTRFLFLFSLALPSVTLGQTLAEAVQIALSQYPSILAAQSRVEAADYDIVTARSGHFPQLSWQGTNSAYSDVSPSPFGPEDRWIQSPTVSMNIWSGWRVQSEVERAQSVYESERQQQRITRDEVAFFVIEAYLNWMRTRELVRLAEENLAAHERLTRDVQQIAAVDQGRRIDVDQALVRTENARLSLEQQISEHQVVAQRLRRMLLGRLPQHPDGYQSIKGTLPSSPEQALAMITDAHPVIAQQRAQISSAEAAVRNAKSGFSPKVDFSYQRQTTQGSGQGDYVAQLNVEVPLFDGGAAYGSTRSAYAELDAAKQDLTEATVTLRENVLSSWSQYISAKQRAVLGKKQVVNAIQLVKGYDEQFRVGRRSLLDLLTIQDNLYSYQSNANNAAFEERIAKARILAILNRLALAYQNNGDANGAVNGAVKVTPNGVSSTASGGVNERNVTSDSLSQSSAPAQAAPNQVTTRFGASTNLRSEYGQ